MKKTLKQILVIIGFIIFILLLTSINANAATLSVSTSKSSVSPGGTFNVTVSVGNGAGSINISVSNGSGSTTQWIENSSYSFTCTAGTSGTVQISASGTVGDFTTETDESKSASKSVSIVEAPVIVKSSDATLSGITVEGYEILPEFSKSVKDYSLTVQNEVTSLNISAKVNNSKARYSITEIPELQVGDNKYVITVTAEDGTKKIYNLVVTRLRENLSLTTLTVSSVDRDGNIIVLNLEPLFSSNVYQYNIEPLSYTIDSLNIEAISNLEGATIETLGNDSLVTGENTITIVATLAEEGKENEVIEYIITVNKDAEPIPLTGIQKIQKWFKDIGISISNWYANNQAKFTASLLILCSTTLIGLTIYFAIDYKKYQILVKKLAELTELNGNGNNIKEQENNNIGGQSDKIKTGGKHSE